MFGIDDNWPQNRAPKVISSDLFKTGVHNRITDCSRFLYNAKEITGSVPEFWNITGMKNVTDCYGGINNNVNNYNDIPKNYGGPKE